MGEISDELDRMGRVGSLLWLIFGAVVIIMIFIGIILMVTNHNKFYYTPETEVMGNYSIPDPTEVRELCKRAGYNSGWVSSGCEKRNQIQCHRYVGTLEEFRCIDV